MNKVILIGNLTKDPESRTSENNVAICGFSIAVSRDFLNKDGERDADFFNIKVFRNKAENCAKYLKKGSKVCVVGRLENRPYTSNDGVKRMVTEIVAEDVEFLTPKAQEEKEEKKATLEEISDNELPF